MSQIHMVMTTCMLVLRPLVYSNFETRLELYKRSSADTSPIPILTVVDVVVEDIELRMVAH